jgi:hypothetical protein
MRTTLASIAVAVALVGGAGAGRVANAGTANGPSNRCYGEIVAGIASTWPWAHNDKVDFAPSPGSVALWIQIFGPQVGVSSVRQLQIRFCTE